MPYYAQITVTDQTTGKKAVRRTRLEDADGNPVPPGEMGEVWMRRTRENETYRYVGAEPRRSEDGWESLGDMGRMDEDGYLYLGDRMQDMILCGGSNIYPAEVEAALQEHPAVRSCAVIGLPDDDLGNVVHAVVEADEDAVSVDELLALPPTAPRREWLRAQLPDGRRWIGMRAGTYLVDQAMKKLNRTSAELVSTSTSEILAAAGVKPPAVP